MSKKIIAGVGVVAALGVAFIPAVSASAETTYITATVTSVVACTSSNNTTSSKLSIGNIAGGNAGSAEFTVTGSTNNPAGLTVTGDPSNLVSGSDTIAYSSTAVDGGTEGWYVSFANTELGVTVGDSIALNSASVTGHERNNTWTLTANVSTATTTTVGTYDGTIEWTCAVNQ